MDKTVVVYKITCLVNGKCYIGITQRNLAKRWQAHINSAEKRNFQTALAKALRKHGKESFTIQALCVVNARSTACLIEQRMIFVLNTIVPFGYNMTKGGDGGATRTGVKTSLSVREKMSKSMKGIPKTPEHIEKMRAHRKGKPLKPEHAAQVRLGGFKNKGKKRTAEQAKNGRLRRRIEAIQGVRVGASGHPGVTPSPNGKWHARIKCDGKRFRLGTFDRIEDAIAAYKKAAAKHIAFLRGEHPHQ